MRPSSVPPAASLPRRSARRTAGTRSRWRHRWRPRPGPTRSPSAIWYRAALAGRGVDVGLLETAGGVRSPLAGDGDCLAFCEAVAPDVRRAGGRRGARDDQCGAARPRALRASCAGRRRTEPLRPRGRSARPQRRVAPPAWTARCSTVLEGASELAQHAQWDATPPVLHPDIPVSLIFSLVSGPTG